MSAKGRPETAGLDEAGPACGTDGEYGRGCRCGMCKLAHRTVCLRVSGNRREREGRPLTRAQAVVRAEDLAEDAGRLWYRAHGKYGDDEWWLEEIIRLPPVKAILAWRERRKLEAAR